MKSNARAASILTALILAAASAAADDKTAPEVSMEPAAETEALQSAPGTEAAPEPEPKSRSKGFFAMDREDLHDWNFEVSGGGMYLDLDGRIGFEIDPPIGEIRFGVDRLDLDRQWDGWVAAQLRFLKKHNLRFVFLPVNFEGNEFLEIGLPLDDPIFNLGDNVSSRAKLYTYQLSYMYDFQIGKYLRISPGLTLGIIDAKIRIEDNTLGLGYDLSQAIPLPEIGLRMEIFPCSRLTIFGEAKGFTIGNKASEWDASAGLKLHVNRNAFFTASYRAIDYDIDWFDVIIDTRFHGPYIGAGFRF